MQNSDVTAVGFECGIIKDRLQFSEVSRHVFKSL
jgi:hypothetical protein